MATPHINAEPGDFAPAVLMPGDPLRARRIAEAILDDARRVNDVRGMLGFTGTHEGRPLSVMGSGMGQPSLTIYATELFERFGVERIIRVGTAGGIAPQVAVGDVVIATGAHTDSAMNRLRVPGVDFSAVADFHLAMAAWREGVEAGLAGRLHAGPIISRDHFYSPPRGRPRPWPATAPCASRWRPPPCTPWPPSTAGGPWRCSRSPTTCSTTRGT